MEHLASIAEIIRYAGALQLAFLVAQFIRFKNAGYYAAFFCFTLVGYLLAPLNFRFGDLFPFRFLILFSAFGVAVAYWLLTLAIFDDHFRLRFDHILALLLLEALSFFTFFTRDAVLPNTLRAIAQLFPQLINLGFVAFALVHLQKGLQGDMIEERRKFRRFFILTSGVYIILVLIAEIAWKRLNEPSFIESINIFSLVSILYYFSFRILELKPRHFLSSQVAVATEAENTLAKKIQTVMQNEKLFQKEDLNARTLADAIGEQDYKVRRAINGALGYRNFYDFLNHYRIKDASAILSDASQLSVPIVRIAMDCGYASLAPFNRAFKALNGVAPSDFRRAALRQKSDQF